MGARRGTMGCMDDTPEAESEAEKVARERWLQGLPPLPSEPVRSGPVPPEVLAEAEALRAEQEAAGPSEAVRWVEEAMAEAKAEEPEND